MHECLSSATVSILVNGSPTKEFQLERRLRQGDPISLLLFLIVAEGLCGILNKAKEVGLIKGVYVGDGNVCFSLIR